MNKLFVSSSSTVFANFTMVTSLGQFREEVNKLFPELGSYLKLRGDWPLYDAVSAIAELVGYAKPEPYESVFPYLNNLWCYMQRNKDHYYYWIL